MKNIRCGTENRNPTGTNGTDSGNVTKTGVFIRRECKGGAKRREGQSSDSGNFQRIENDRFFRYNLKDKLLMVDEDMHWNLAKSTNITDKSVKRVRGFKGIGIK